MTNIKYRIYFKDQVPISVEATKINIGRNRILTHAGAGLLEQLATIDRAIARLHHARLQFST